MLKKVLSLGLALVVVLAFGATAAFADGGEESDGRLNPPGSLYAVYYHHEELEQLNDDGEWYIGDAITGIEIWVADPTTFIGQLGFYTPIDADALQASSGTIVQIASGSGYSVVYFPLLESFMVTMPTGYGYMWDAWWAD